MWMGTIRTNDLSSNIHIRSIFSLKSTKIFICLSILLCKKLLFRPLFPIVHQTAPPWHSYHLNIWAYISRKESQILRHSVHFWTIWILKFWGNLEKSWELLSHDSVINRWSPILIWRQCFKLDVRMLCWSRGFVLA